MENLSLKIRHYPQMVILSGVKHGDDNWLFKCIPHEFDLSKVNSNPEEESKEEEKMEVEGEQFDVSSTIYELRNIITVNSRSSFFDMVNVDDGEWSGYAQGDNFDDIKSTMLEYVVPREADIVPIEDSDKWKDLSMNCFFVELNPVIVIYMKKDIFEHTAKKYEGRFWKKLLNFICLETPEDNMQFYDQNEIDMMNSDIELAKKLQEEMDKEEREK